MQSDDAPDPAVRDVVIAMIVAHALDDLEAEHVDLPTVLTLTALAGWREADRSAGRAIPATGLLPAPASAPGPGRPSGEVSSPGSDGASHPAIRPPRRPSGP